MLVNMDWQWIGLAVVGIILLLAAWKRFYNFGARHWWFFETLHFIGGFLLAMFLFGLTGSRASVLFGLLVITLVWEALEYTAQAKPRFGHYLDRRLGLAKTYYSGWDTLLDIVLNFAGAAVFLYFFT